VQADASTSGVERTAVQEPVAVQADTHKPSAQITPTPKSAPKSVPRSVRAQVFTRDQQCQWQDSKTGKRCSSRHQLQVDHRRPQWADGDHTLENLQVLCGVHNRQKYQQETGLRFKGL
jgi:5-methylcytosine-specific restriction endonuclease McrA